MTGKITKHVVTWISLLLIFQLQASGRRAPVEENKIKESKVEEKKQIPPKQTIAEHPDSLEFDALDWEIPLGTPYRSELENGPVAYVAVDSSLPLINLQGYIRYGSLEDPADKKGLGTLMSKLLRTGGTEKYQADSLDKLIDLLAMRFSFSQNESHISFKASFLSENLNTAMNVMEQMFFHPTFQPEKIQKEKSILKQYVKHRFVNPEPVLKSAYNKLMYPKSDAARLISAASLDSISRDDLVALHRKVFTNREIVISASGKFNRNEMVTRLNRIFSPVAEHEEKKEPEIKVNPELKALVVDKKINQAYVRMGLPLFKRPHPDYYSVSILNLILGGGGFNSRLATRIRSDEGLTYSIYSHSESNYLYPGTLYINFYTKSQSFSRAVTLVLQELQKIREEGVTKQELENARTTYISQLPSMFRSPEDIVSTYAMNEFFGRSPDHYRKYPKALRSITQDDVQNAAKKYLNLSEIRYSIVGDTGALFDESGDFFSLDSLKEKKVISTDSLPSLP
ncbi:MAG: M16 family metallopeptidase [Chitinispirillaceae bacterium]